MKKNLLLFVLLFAEAFANAQIVLEESLVNKFTASNDSLPANSDDLPGWTFNSCYGYNDNSTVYLQVGSSKKSGSLITRSLTGLSGNARVSFDAYVIDDDMTIDVSTEGTGTLSKISFTSTKSTWQRQPAILLRGADELTRIKFYSSGDTKRRFEIRNIQVYDIGDHFYYETFDHCNAAGGNDGTFNFSTTPCNDNSLDYPDAQRANLCQGDRCLYFNGAAREYAGSQAVYTIPSIPITVADGGNAVLTFRVAGTNLNAWLDVKKSGKLVQNASITYGAWTTVTVNLGKMGSSEPIVLTGNNCYIDDVALKEVVKQPTIDEAQDNSVALADAEGYNANVTLKRTLREGIWNTLCLPFSFRASMIADAELKVLTSVEDGVYTFTPATTVAAGEPFLIRVSSTVANPTFDNVTMACTEPQAKTFGSYSLNGTFSPQDLATDGSQLFLATDGQLYCPDPADYQLGGLRAYFVVPVNQQARVVLSDEVPTAIHVAGTDRCQDLVYDLYGRRVDSESLSSGIYVKNGKKLIFK